MIKKWIDKRIKERSTIDGVLMVAAGAAIIIFSPLTKLIAYAAIAYGAWTIWRQE
jgi:hypothetical protein|tara:strand:+ start:1717 stop:1881 length:165 start_codon:yes stop_codon:yes gene_type:complete